MIGFFSSPLSLAYLPSLPLIENEGPLLLPSISKLESLPLQKLTFHFSTIVLKNRRTLQSCTTALRRIDNLLSKLSSVRILRTIQQATRLTYKNCEIPSQWKYIVEDTFHCHIMKSGSCPRDLYADYLDSIEKWLENLAELLEKQQWRQGAYVTKTSLLLKET